MRISAVLIVQNEEQMLPRCLGSLKGVDEIVVCDQGSKDNTIEIAKQFTDKVFTDHQWEDSFCKARNAAKAHATGDWILSIDADEVLHDVSELRETVELATRAKYPAVDVRMIADDNGQFFYYPRLFRNIPEIHWEGDIHNHLNVEGKQIGNTRITHGYSPAHRLDPNRALRILEKSVRENHGPREMYYLGREYYYRGVYDKSIEILNQYVELSRYLAEKADAYLILARDYIAIKKPDEARTMCANALIINANFREAILLMAELSWDHNAVQWKRMAETATNQNVLFVRGEI
jgi:glycosyltransferase involved in cell wall biosynthesis